MTGHARPKHSGQAHPKKGKVSDEWLFAACGKGPAPTIMTKMPNGWSCPASRIGYSFAACPILWQLARVTLRINKDSGGFLSRVGVVQPTSDKFRFLAFCHALHHCCVNDNTRMKDNAEPQCSQTVQSVACELCDCRKHRTG